MIGVFNFVTRVTFLSFNKGPRSATGQPPVISRVLIAARLATSLTGKSPFVSAVAFEITSYIPGSSIKLVVGWASVT
jgi:hypothetical protein